VTVYVPAVLYICVGLGVVLRPPSPKSQDQAATLPAVVSRNDTVSGVVPDAGDSLKLATGADVVGGGSVGAGVGVGVGVGVADGTVNWISLEWGLSCLAES
jgi:hypothetical protein